MTNFEEISKQAEADLNTYQAKTGEARAFGVDDAGANTLQAEKFPGAEVQHDDDLSTNRGYDTRIPPSEGGTTDDRGRETRGHHFEGHGGPIDKINDSYEKQPGQDDNDVVPANVPNVEGLGSVEDIATKGRSATMNNTGK